MDDKIIIEYYKVTRGSVEHFDRLLAHFRQIMFAFNGIFISSGVALLLNDTKIDEIGLIRCFLIGNLLAIINILIWLLEKHYHRYLIASAEVANKIEKELFPGDEEKHLTYQLWRTKEYRVQREKFSLRRLVPWIFKQISHGLYKLFPFIRSYDLIYLLPLAGALVFNLFLGYRASACKFNNWLLPISYSSMVIYLIIGVVIVKHNHSFEREIKSGQTTLIKQCREK